MTKSTKKSDLKGKKVSVVGHGDVSKAVITSPVPLEQENSNEDKVSDIAEVKKPSFMFLENVKHIKKIDNGEVFKHILKRINETGYHVETFELSPHQLGVPQQRDRIIFVCIRNDLYDESIQLDMTPQEVPINFDSIIETDKEKTQKYRISDEHNSILEIWDEMVKKFDVGQSIGTVLCNEFNAGDNLDLPPYKRDIIAKNKPLYDKYQPMWDKWLHNHQKALSKRKIYDKLEWQAGKKQDNDSIFNHFIQFRQSGIRVKKSKYFPTLVAIVQTPIYMQKNVGILLLVSVLPCPFRPVTLTIVTVLTFSFYRNVRFQQ